MNKNYLYIGAGVGVVVVLLVAYSLLRSGSSPPTAQNGGGNFGTGQNRNVTVTAPTGSNEPLVGQTTLATTSTKVFEINAGPVAGAVLMQMGRPTTTVARFVMADSGHVFDLTLDSPGSLARAVSNTTIPGIDTVQWVTASGKAGEALGSGAVLQYIDKNTTKTLELAFPPATTTLTTAGAVHIQFFPDGIQDIAASQNGLQVGYLVLSAGGAGVDVYTANPNSSAGAKLASLPLAQVLLLWPSTQFLLAQSPAANGVPGVVYSVNARTGAVVPLIYANGVTATADPNFNKVVYQSAEQGSRGTYVRDVATGGNTPLSFDPLPEQCAWSHTYAMVMLCAAPLAYVPSNFLDLWHMGVGSAADSLFAFNVASGASTILAAPGSSVDGGEPADIAALSVSPDDRYLVFIRKGDRSLWGVRLSQ